MEEAYSLWAKNAVNNQKVNLADGSIQREFSMDETEYDHIAELAEKDEFIDFEVPTDAPEGKRLGNSVLGDEQDPDQIPVNLDEMFKGHAE